MILWSIKNFYLKKMRFENDDGISKRCEEIEVILKDISKETLDVLEYLEYPMGKIN